MNKINSVKTFTSIMKPGVPYGLNMPHPAALSLVAWLNAGDIEYYWDWGSNFYFKNSQDRLVAVLKFA